MPRDSQGNFSLVNGALVNIGETITPSQHNPPFQDVAQALSDSLSRSGLGGMTAPLAMGGNRITGAAAGVQPTDVAIVAQISTAGGVPAGVVADFAGSVAPTGWLICAGQTLSRASFPDLFAAIGTTYGAPSGATFNLPDTRGRVSAGRDVDQGGFAGRLTTPNSQTLGATGGAQTVTLTTTEMPSHSHAVTGSTNSAGAHTHLYNMPSGFTFAGGGGGNAYNSLTAASVNSGGDHTHSITASAADTGGGAGHANVQPTIIFTKIIKT